uniref:uncharacterized protein LOC124033046 n=1 Tax=Oncorhynchus gorbuscha TaxID=8017 RepID=UPI001EAEA7CA|nr:uncharacterized protein LOC124033046 [Oncorhynchus gorbuscha]
MDPVSFLRGTVSYPSSSTSHSAASILDLNQHIHIHPHSGFKYIFTGESVKVRAIIVNNSTRPVTPKYYLYEKQCFYAQKKRKVHTHNILKEKGDQVPAGTRQTVTQVLTIPPQLPATIFNCPILKLEYRLKVVLDVKLAIDPEIKLPIVVLTATQTLGQEPPPYSSFGFESQVPTASELPPPPTKCLLPHQISIENCRGMEILNWAQKSVLYSTPPSSSSMPQRPIRGHHI